ncbi:MAG: hypothetical protein FJZ47_07735 [Candidatus Tectomicrobia bacterium]|uniref:Ribosomal RNA small subunit methyltransferase B-like ferredoxin-like domain-containing protein n=1 Tax=Tectimicrobiota bacterium TaxID=2528274 RepID=A0A937VZX5_UNCTE|nr:hypothetical protein [Candidatus Tectomicrobia bacterium]
MDITAFAPYASFIPDFPAFCTALQAPRTCCLRVNTLRTTPEVVQALLIAQGYDVMSSPLAPKLLLVDHLSHPGRLREALLGYYHPQAFTSALAARSWRRSLVNWSAISVPRLAVKRRIWRS